MKNNTLDYILGDLVLANGSSVGQQKPQSGYRKNDRLTSGLAKLGGKVITQAVLFRTTVSESSSIVQLRPQLRQAAARCRQCGRQCSGTMRNKKITYKIGL